MDINTIVLHVNRVLLLLAVALLLVISFFLANICAGIGNEISWGVLFLLLLPCLTWFAWRIPRYGFKRRLIVNIVIFSFCLYAIITGGIVIDCKGGFGGGWEEVAVEGSLSWSIWIDDEAVTAFPLICWIYHNKKPPYTIHILIRDETKKTCGINIEKVNVEYDGGRISSHSIISWSKTLDDWGMSKILNADIRYVIDEARTCSVEFEGSFVDSSGIKKPFKVRTKKKIEYSEHESRIYTLWSGMHD